MYISVSFTSIAFKFSQNNLKMLYINIKLKKKNAKKKKIPYYALNQLRYRLLIDSQVFSLDELSALNVHYFPTFSCT